MWTQLKKISEKERTICVDVDNTLLTYDGYEKNTFGESIPEVVEKLRELKNKGINLILSTARGKDELPALEEHLRSLNLYDLFDEIKAGEKIPAIAYLDDKALNVKDEDWMDKLDDMLVGESKKKD